MNTTRMILLCLLVPALAGAQVVAFNNFSDENGGFGAGDSASGIGGVGRFDYADGFVAEASGVLTDIWLAIGYWVDAEAQVLVAIAPGTPGELPSTDSISESWPVADMDQAAPSGTPPVHLTGSGATYLEEGQYYWVFALSVDDPTALWIRSAFDMAPPQVSAVRSAAEPWSFSVTDQLHAFRVDVQGEVGVESTTLSAVKDLFR